MSENELDLRRRALQGEAAAFDELIAPLLEPALRLAYSILGDRSEAEDATQESIMRAWRKLNQVRSGMPMRPWFLAIVANQCRTVRRARWFHAIRVPDVVQRHEIEPNVEEIDLKRALRRLSVSDRQVIFMYFYLDMPVEEVAFALRVSPAAAKGRIYRACRRLKFDLQEEDLR